MTSNEQTEPMMQRVLSQLRSDAAEGRVAREDWEGNSPERNESSLKRAAAQVTENVDISYDEEAAIETLTFDEAWAVMCRLAFGGTA